MALAQRQVTRELAGFVHDAPAGGVSARGLDVVRQGVLDLCGVTIAAGGEPASRIAVDYARSQAANGPAAVLGRGVRLAPTLAALVNGTAGHAPDFDDIALGAGHVSVAIVPAVLAVAELTGADGAAFVDALVVGYEVAHRLPTMYPDTRLGPYAAGYHKPSVYSVFGAAAGAARLLDLTATETAHALGIAEALEQRFGWHDVICAGEGDLDAVLDGLGDGYVIDEGLVFKLYPCCGANHYAIDGTIALTRDQGLREVDVDHVDVWIEQRNLNEVLVYPWPRTPLEGKFSLAYNVAAALADGEVTVDTFTAPALVRLEAVRDKVRVHATTELPQNGARIAITTIDGRTLEREQLGLRGGWADPSAFDELEGKFRANVAGRIRPEVIDEVVAAIGCLEKQRGLAAVTEPLLG